LRVAEAVLAVIIDHPTMSEDKERQQAQKDSEFLVLGSVWYFLEQHGHRRNASRILYRSYYGTVTGDTNDIEIRNGFFILLLKKNSVLGKWGDFLVERVQDSLWDVYVDQYWPSYKPSTVNRYVEKAKTWAVEQFLLSLGNV